MILKLAFIFAILIISGCAFGQATTVSYLDASVPPPDDMVRPAPADGSIAATNPPSFVWLPEPDAATYTLQCSRGKGFTGTSTLTIEDIKLNLRQPAKTMPAGKWYWRYRAVRTDGKESAWSSARSFTVPADAPEFAVPPIRELMTRISPGHPRLFVRQEELEALRESRLTSRRASWQALEEIIESKKGLPLMKEPPPYKDQQDKMRAWKIYYAEVRTNTAAIEYLAFGYLASGNREYAEEAKRYIFHFCSWDPEGTSSNTYNDELNMPIVVAVSRAYDWMYDAFTAEERETIKTMMRSRIRQLYTRLKAAPYEAKPFSSHSSRALMFLGMSSIAFLGDIPECADWLDYVTQTFCCVYPPWGGPDGSYSEGPWYWSSYMGWAFQFAYVMKTATGVDIMRKPYFRNTGWYALYCIPPTNKMMPFGDGIWLAPSSAHQINMYCLSTAHKNPYFRWYVEQFAKPLGASNMLYLWGDEAVEAKAPTDLPPSRAFFDKGVVAMHSDLANGADDIQFQMRSSPDGAWSHAFADQNSFYLQAFGEALAIPTGYRPYYGDEHHTKWTWQTKAHNSILVNGEGQDTRTRSSHGRITAALLTSEFDYACGDASKAYGGRLDKFLRHVLFFRPDYFVLIDELAAPSPSTYDWRLHAWDRMEVMPETGRIITSRGDARLLTQFVWPKERLRFSQTDQFTVPPSNGAANQWHLTAATATSSKHKEFLTVLYPYRSGRESALPEIERIDAPGVSGVRLRGSSSEDLVLLNRLPSRMIVEGVSTDAHIAAVRRSTRGISSAFLVSGQSISVNRTELLSADVPVTLSMMLGKGKRSITVKCDQATSLRIRVDAPNPRSFRSIVRVDGRYLGPAEYAFDEDACAVAVNLPAGEHRVEITAKG